jgi:hypothetical protein
MVGGLFCVRIGREPGVRAHTRRVIREQALAGSATSHDNHFSTVPKSILKTKIISLESYRHEITDTIDFLITGI